MALLGDAAHPLLPFGSQGGTQAIIDCQELKLAHSDLIDVAYEVKVEVLACAEDLTPEDLVGVAGARGDGGARALRRFPV